jgi:hypothetical protein
VLLPWLPGSALPRANFQWFARCWSCHAEAAAVASNARAGQAASLPMIRLPALRAMCIDRDSVGLTQTDFIHWDHNGRV